ncbi:hypothetical protein PRIPAC_88176 [Pristionchus pacificus]|uniref:Uncharacterized protein n=1 Tax=Pristionchus pacificus TaxID=54126 RepID=A0A2A6B966_PRIPA|nr:hypothetical protein PRIPAC_88176 [Pristionchus pacificus]|eukprot:PDM62407.1 hypothetical protein PRIPAC_51849 [Pristionchus pacificus]
MIKPGQWEFVQYPDEDGQRKYQDIARFDAPFCALSLLPAIYLLNSYRKDKESWNREKALLAPAFTVLGITAVLGLVTEVHLTTMNWLDIGSTPFSCNWTFNTLLMIGTTPYLFMPIIPLIQLINCFVKIRDIIKQRVSYIWAIFLLGIRLCSPLFGTVQHTDLCGGARFAPVLFQMEYFYAYLFRNLSVILGGFVIATGLLLTVLQRFNITIQFISVDFHTIKRSAALTFPTLCLIIFQYLDQTKFYWGRHLHELNQRILFSSCHFGFVATILLILNHRETVWKFITKSLFCQRRERIEISTKIMP